MNIKIDKSKIRETLFGPLEKSYDNFFITNLHATNLYLLPKLVIIDTPINYFDFNINDVQNVNTDYFYTLTDEEKSKITLDIPTNDNNSIQWRGDIGQQYVSGQIINNNYIGGISSNFINLFNSNSTNYGDILDKIKDSEKNNVKNYIEQIIYKGKRISINIDEKYNEDEKILNLKIYSSIYSGANSTNLVADGSSAAIYDVSGIQKMSISFTEYKKF